MFLFVCLFLCETHIPLLDTWKGQRDSQPLKSEENMEKHEFGWLLLGTALQSHLAGETASFILREAKKKIDMEVKESLLHVTI